MAAEDLLPAALRARIDELAIQARRAHRGRMQGDRRSPTRGESVEFSDYRPYTPGDDLRRIDWNAFARSDRLIVKLFVAEEDQHVHIAVDTSASMAWGEPSKLVAALRLAAALGYTGLAGGDWVSIVPIGEAAHPQEPLRGRDAAPELVRRLARVDAKGPTFIAASLRGYARATSRRGPMVVISDLFDATAVDGLSAAAAAGFDLTILHLLAPEEELPQLDGDLQLVDVESLDAVEVTVDGAVLAAYHDRLEAWRADLRRWSAARDAVYIPVSAATAVDEVVLGPLRKLKVLG
jgi:uncharacterized protein (DUF58 family)